MSHEHIHNRLQGTRHKVSDHLLDVSGGKDVPPQYVPLTQKAVATKQFIQDFIQDERKELLSVYKKEKKAVRGWFHSLKAKLPALYYFLEGVKFVGITVVIFGIFFVASNFSAYSQMVEYWYYENVNPAQADETIQQLERPLTSSQDLVIQKGGLSRIDMEVAPSDFRIIIPKLRVNAPVVESAEANNAYAEENWQGLESAIQVSLQSGAVHYPYTANPGDPGNVFITGHSSYYPGAPGKYKSIFALLEKLVIGDDVIVYHKGQKYIYKVYDVFIVSPSQVEVLDQDPTRFDMTLMSCWPVGTANSRYIVKLHQTFPEPDVSKVSNIIGQESFKGVELGAFR